MIDTTRHGSGAILIEGVNVDVQNVRAVNYDGFGIKIDAANVKAKNLVAYNEGLRGFSVEDFQNLIALNLDSERQAAALQALEHFLSSEKREAKIEQYERLTNILANHVTIFGPSLDALANMIAG